VQEPTVGDGLPPRAVLLLDLQGSDRELDEQRRMSGQDADVPVDTVRDDLGRLARPDLPLGRDDVDVEGH
jgi:hypothetical protein